MKKCSDCNVEMVETKLYGKPRFIDMEHDIDKFYVCNKIDENKRFYSKSELLELKARVCPKCGKVETYVDLEQ